MKHSSVKRTHLKKEYDSSEYYWFHFWKLLLFVILVATVSGMLDWSSKYFLSSWWPLAWGLLWFIWGLTKVASFSQKKGVGLGYFLVFGLVTMNVNDVGIFGWEKLVLFFFAGVIFEILFQVVNKKSLYWAKVFATFISLITLPLIASLVVSGTWVDSLSLPLINMTILIGTITLPLSLIFNLFFSLLRTRSWFLRMESHLN